MKILVKEYLKAENRNSYYRKHFHFATGASRSDSLQISFDCRLSDLLASSGWLWLKRWSHRRRGEGRCRAQLCTCCGSRCQWEPVPASARSPVTTRVPSQIQQVGGSHLNASQVLPQGSLLPYWSGLPILAGVVLARTCLHIQCKRIGDRDSRPAQWEFAGMR